MYAICKFGSKDKDGLWITSEKREGTQYDETHQRKNFYIPITLILYELGSLDLAWKQK